MDANQSSIIGALMACGATVQPLHQVGSGCPDLLVGIRGKNLLLECKDGRKPPSARRLTPDQERWHAEWRGQFITVCTEAEAIAALTTPRLSSDQLRQALESKLPRGTTYTERDLMMFAIGMEAAT